MPKPAILKTVDIFDVHVFQILQRLKNRAHTGGTHSEGDYPPLSVKCRVLLSTDSASFGFRTCTSDLAYRHSGIAKRTSKSAQITFRGFLTY